MAKPKITPTAAAPAAGLTSPKAPVAVLKNAEDENLVLPEKIRAFTTIKCPGGWVFIELTLDPAMNVTGFAASQPDVKAIVHEKFKLAVGRYWQNQEG